MPTLTDDMYNTFISKYMGTDWRDNLSVDYAINSGILQHTINRIAKTEVLSVDSLENPFAKWNKPYMSYGDTIQKYRIKRTSGDTFEPDAADTDDYKYYPAEVMSQYSVKNERKKYPITITDTDFMRMFTGPQGYDDFVSAIHYAVQQTNDKDKNYTWRTYISDMDKFVGTGSVVSVPWSGNNTETEMETLINTIRDYTDDLFVENKGEYNKYGYEDSCTVTGSADIIMRRKDIKNIATKINSKIFNPEFLNLNGSIMKIKDFGTPEGTYAGKEILAIVADNRMFGYYPERYDSSAVRNHTRDRINTFLHVNGLYTGDQTMNICYILAQ